MFAIGLEGVLLDRPSRAVANLLFLAAGLVPISEGGRRRTRDCTRGFMALLHAAQGVLLEHVRLSP